MATTYKPSHSKFWYARYFDGTGTRVSRSTKSELRREAKRIAETMETQARREAKQAPDRGAMQLDIRRIFRAAEIDFDGGTLTPARGLELLKQLMELANPARLPSFKQVSGEWLDAAEKRTENSTWKSYRDGIKHVVTILAGKADLPIDRITAADVASIQQGMIETGLRGKTVNMHLSCVRRIFAHAVASGFLLTNPAATIRAVSSSDSRRRAPFTPAEIGQLMKSAPSEEWRGLVILGATTGMRGGDVRRLTSENIQGGFLVILASKTKKTTRTILKLPLHKQALKWLQGRTGVLFPTLAAMSGSEVSNAFKAIMKSAKVPNTIELAPGVPGYRSMHSLRHSFASMLANAGIAEDVRRKLTGHASSLVHSKYSHHTTALETAIESLPTL
jgi:integrase